MKEQQSILVPTDFSDFSAEAMRRAVRLAQMLNAHIHVLHVIDDSLVLHSSNMEGMPIPVSESVFLSLEEIASKRLRDWMQNWPDIEAQTHVVHTQGSLAETICEEAERIPAQLIVIGKHGHQSFLEHLLIGSTTEKVVRHARCSVLVALPHGILGDQQEEEAQAKEN